MGIPEDDELRELRELAKNSGLTVEPAIFVADKDGTRGTLIYSKTTRNRDAAPIPTPDLTDFQKRFPITEAPLNYEKIREFGNVYIRMTALGPEPILTPALLEQHTEISAALFGPFERTLDNPLSEDQNGLAAWKPEAERLGFILFPYIDKSRKKPEARIGYGFRGFILMDALSGNTDSQPQLAGLDDVALKNLNMTLEGLRRGVNRIIDITPDKHRFFSTR